MRRLFSNSKADFCIPSLFLSLLRPFSLIFFSTSNRAAEKSIKAEFVGKDCFSFIRFVYGILRHEILSTFCCCWTKKIWKRNIEKNERATKKNRNLNFMNWTPILNGIIGAYYCIHFDLFTVYSSILGLFVADLINKTLSSPENFHSYSSVYFQYEMFDLREQRIVYIVVVNQINNFLSTWNDDDWLTGWKWSNGWLPFLIARHEHNKEN